MDSIFNFSSDIVGIFQNLSSGLFTGIDSLLESLKELSS